MPGLVLIADPTRGDGLLAAKTVLGKLLLMARGAVDVVPLGQETLRAYWLLAFEAGEALLVPHFVLVLNILRAWHNDLVAGLAAGAFFTGVAFATHDLAIIPGTEGLIGQGLVALGTAEAVLMPMPVLVIQLLGICADGAAAFGTGVGAELFKTAHADMLAVLFDILLALQVVAAVEAVKAISHCGTDIVARPGGSKL